MVANNLESANHLANGEETEALGQQNTARNQLWRRDVPYCLDGVGATEEGAGVLNARQEIPEKGLESRYGPNGEHENVHMSTNNRHLGRSGPNRKSAPRPLSCEVVTYGGVIFRDWKTSLDSSRPTLE